MGPRSGRAVALAVVLVGLLVGCATDDTTGMGSGASDSIGYGNAGVSCSDTNQFPAPGPSLAPLPAGFVPIAATRCLLRPTPVTGDGEWLVRVEQRADAGLTAVTQELRRPGAPAGAQPICPAIAYLPTIITLIDATGATFVPAVPTTACGAPLVSAIAAIQALPWQGVRETPIRQLRSELEITSGCAGAYKPMVAVLAAEAPSGSGNDPALPGPAGPLQVCRFELTTDASADSTIDAGGQHFRLGTLAGASTVEGERLATFTAALANAPIAGACGQPQAPFAVVFPKGGGGPSIVVETAGCYRFLRDGSSQLRQLDPATVALLL